jgi:protein-S-isoprenylcysteine O-methyltransferase Ste14
MSSETYINKHNFGQNIYIWNPWVGCDKITEGCDNCYVCYPSQFRDLLYNFNFKKVAPGEVVTCCLLSDFFLEQADHLRPTVWAKIKKHSDIIFMIIYVIGICFNLLGRYYLGHNWGNNVVIYNDHTLVNNGVYKIVRHPLYASIIWMIYSVGVLFQNYLVIILNTFVFIPFMYYRAKQEEKELVKIFSEYKKYREKTGMFFPKII